MHAIRAAAVAALFALVGCATGAGGPAGSERGFSAPGVQRLNDTVRAEVTSGKIPGAVVLIVRNGKVEVDEVFGVIDAKSGAPMPKDAIFRIYSMTKPIVSVGVMMLVEEGKVQLSDPASKYFPEFRDLKVGLEKPGPDGKPALELAPMQREMSVLDLLRHTSGLTYGVFGTSLVKTEYGKADVDSNDLDNQELIRRLTKVPLQFQPGTTWEYGRSTDVLGALIERVSGKTLDVFLKERILGPLKMSDTDFWVDPSKHARIAEPFALEPLNKQPINLINVRTRPQYLSGGGGMVSTARDYLRFAQMLLNGGELDGVRIVSPHTIRFMTTDHTAGITGAARGPAYGPGPGYGFGLGFAVRQTNGNAPWPGTAGDYNWGGLGGTYFWIDPEQKTIAIWMMQSVAQRVYMRGLYRGLVYGAMNQ